MWQGIYKVFQFGYLLEWLYLDKQRLAKQTNTVCWHFKSVFLLSTITPFLLPTLPPPMLTHRTCIHVWCVSTVTISYAGGGQPNGCLSGVGPHMWGISATSTSHEHWQWWQLTNTNNNNSCLHPGLHLPQCQPHPATMRIMTNDNGCLCPMLHLPQCWPHRTCIHVWCMSMVTIPYAGGGLPNGCSSGVGPHMWGISATSPPCE